MSATNRGVTPANHQRRTGSLFWVALPYVVLVLFHAAFGIFRERPLIFCDELGYLGNARYLSGTAAIPDLSQCAFYHFGYSLFLLPAFWLFSDPTQTYRCVMMINALLISALYFPLYFVLRRLLQNTPKNSAWIAFVCCLYPAFLLQSEYAWAESAFLPVYACALALLVAMLQKPSWLSAILFGFAAAFTYTIHPRALSTVPFTIFFLIFIGWLKVIPRSKIFVAALVALFTFIVTGYINAQIGSAGWGSNRPVPYSFSKMLSLLLTGDGIRNYVLLVFGQILYLLQSSYGLFFLSVIFIGRTLWQRRKLSWMEALRDHTVLLVLFASGSFLLSLLSMNIAFQSSFQHRAMRGDHLMYGRYNEGFLPIYLAFGLHALQSGFFKAIKLRRLALAFILLVASLTLLIDVGRSSELESSRYQMANIAGIFPFIRQVQHVIADDNPAIESYGVGKFGLLIASTAACLLFVLLLQLFRKHFRAGMALLMIVFVSVGLFNLWRVLRFDLVRTMPVLPSYVEKLGPVKELSYDLTFRSQYFLYQYFLKDIRFTSFYSDRGEKPKTAVVISARSWPDAKNLNARFLIKEKGADQVLWLLPGSITLADKFSYFDKNLVLIPVPGVTLSGFYSADAKKSGRWTDGKGRLEVPVDPLNYPDAMKIQAVARDPIAVTIMINGQTVFSEQIKGAWSNTFALSELNSNKWLTVDILSDTFVPRLTRSRSKDNRTLGVFVNALVLTKQK